MHLDICITVAQTFRLGEYAYFYYHHQFIKLMSKTFFILMIIGIFLLSLYPRTIRKRRC
jgi:hypothetical protein